MLENLVVAVESEAQIVDIGRVSGFMQKVRTLKDNTYSEPTF
jgi:regulatory protein SWI6